MTDLIAEIGSSPAPDWNFEAWWSVASWAGATHIKAQMFRADHFPAAEQESKRPLEFPRERLAGFIEFAHEYRLMAGVSVFDNDAVKLAAQHCDFIKLAAREQDNSPLFVACLLAQKPIYRSVSKSNK